MLGGYDVVLSRRNNSRRLTKLCGKVTNRSTQPLAIKQHGRDTTRETHDQPPGFRESPPGPRGVILFFLLTFRSRRSYEKQYWGSESDRAVPSCRGMRIRLPWLPRPGWFSGKHCVIPHFPQESGRPFRLPCRAPPRFCPWLCGADSDGIRDNTHCVREARAAKSLRLTWYYISGNTRHVIPSILVIYASIFSEFNASIFRNTCSVWSSQSSP